jgi:hypothetical protein
VINSEIFTLSPRFACSHCRCRHLFTGHCVQS